MPDASVIHIRSDTPDSQSSEHELVIDHKPAAATVSVTTGSKVVAMPTVHPAPEPVSPEPIATQSSRSVARLPEPTFVSIPAVSVVPTPVPAMVPLPTMVPAPAPVPAPISSAVFNDNIVGPSLPPPSQHASAAVEKTKPSSAAVVKSGQRLACCIVF